MRASMSCSVCSMVRSRSPIWCRRDAREMIGWFSAKPGHVQSSALWPNAARVLKSTHSRSLCDKINHNEIFMVQRISSSMVGPCTFSCHQIWPSLQKSLNTSALNSADEVQKMCVFRARLAFHL